MSNDQQQNGMAGLPYFHDYLQKVLRPRVEEAAGACAAALEEAAWAHLIEVMIQEQPEGQKMEPEQLRQLLESQLGLRLRVTLETSFAGSGATGGEGKAVRVEPGTHRSNGVEGEVVDGVARRRSPMNPLANAVFGGGRKTSI